MKASLSVLIAALAAGVVADLHYTGICIDTNGGVDAYNQGATEKACDAYKARNTGNKQWDQCPDCTLKNENDVLYYCESAAQHIGGDELNYYCRQNGAGDSIAW